MDSGNETGPTRKAAGERMKIQKYKRKNMETNKKEKQIKKEPTEEIVKITVTKEAGDNLNQFLIQVNEGFDAGKVNRQDIASWIICYFKKLFGENEIQQIRKEFFKERALLESIIKKAKTTGDMPDFIKDALFKHWSGDTVTKKSTKRMTQEVG